MQVLFARLQPLAVAYGPLTAVRRDVFDGFGGLERLADNLCDDAALGRLVRDLGYDVAFTPAVAETLVNDATLGQLFHHELRWARTVRGLSPLGYCASLVGQPGPLPLLLLLHPGSFAVAGIALPILMRWLVARLVISRFGSAPGLVLPGLFGLWLRDLACFFVWASAFLVGRVSWRGRLLPIGDGDIIASVPRLPEHSA